MSVPRPHFLLFSDSHANSRSAAPGAERQRPQGTWRFVLEAVDGHNVLQAEDVEAETSSDRLALLAVVRGLEALDQPSRVTLVTNNRYVARGLRFGLREWRDNHWRWEQFGQMTPIPNSDLWRRVDGALRYHHVECRSVETQWQGDASPAARTHLSATPLRRRSKVRRVIRALGDRFQQLHHWWTSGRGSASHAAC